jgi:hypothetical protein
MIQRFVVRVDDLKELRILVSQRRPVFQIRSNWTQFPSFLSFVRLDFSISCVFSIRVNIPTPPLARS